MEHEVVNNGLEKKINQLEERFIQYHQNLNTSGIWLFLATLGCWSVQNESIRVVATWIALILFIHRLITGLQSFKLFNFQIKEIEVEIDNSSLVEDSKKARFFDLLALKNKYARWTRIVKYLPAYYLGIAFLILSMAHWTGKINI